MIEGSRNRNSINRPALPQPHAHQSQSLQSPPRCRHTLVRPNHMTNSRWRSSNTQTLRVSVLFLDRLSKTRLKIIMFTTLFREHCRHICCAFVGGRDGRNWLPYKSVRKQETFARKKTCATPFTIGRNRHHTNQSQNYMANHVIWLLRNRGKFWEGRWRNSDGDGDNDSDSEFWELTDLWHLACLKCIVSVK